MVLGRSVRALKRLLDSFQRSDEVLGVMLTPKIAANPQKIEKKCVSKRQAVPEWFFDGFLVEDK